MGWMKPGGKSERERERESADPKGEKRKWPKRSEKRRKGRGKESRPKRERESNSDGAIERSGTKGREGVRRGVRGSRSIPTPVAHPPLKKELILIRFFI